MLMAVTRNGVPVASTRALTEIALWASSTASGGMFFGVSPSSVDGVATP
jgi:hypothetical protein